MPEGDSKASIFAQMQEAAQSHQAKAAKMRLYYRDGKLSEFIADCAEEARNNYNEFVGENSEGSEAETNEPVAGHQPRDSGRSGTPRS